MRSGPFHRRGHERVVCLGSLFQLSLDKRRGAQGLGAWVGFDLGLIGLLVSGKGLIG